MPLSPGRLLLWLGLAVLAQVLVALFGVISRSLQTKTVPPIPALRLLLVLCLLPMAVLMAIDVSTRAAAAAWQWRLKKQQQRRQQQQHGGGSASKLYGGSDGDGSIFAADSEQGMAAVAAAAAAAAFERVQMRPEVPLRRGLSRKMAGLEARHPLAFRWLAALAIAVGAALAGGCQVVAPGLVDAAIVQLVNTFGVLLVVFIQSLLLGHRLPLLVWPCAAGTVAGAAMIIVPSVGKGGRGGLDSSQAWLGFGLSVVSMLGATSMYICLQAFRRLKLSATTIQYLYLSLTLVVALPLSLSIDGTDWNAQFGPWGAGDWAQLVLGGTVIYVGQNYLLQYTTYQLGAPLVSMLYGLRLVASILLSKAMLSYTVIKTPVQIVGAVLTVSSVTLYMGHGWLMSRRQTASMQAATGACAAAAAGASQSGASEGEAAADAPGTGGTAGLAKAAAASLPGSSAPPAAAEVRLEVS